MNRGKLIVARHHESEWNKLGLWTGARDRHLTDYGFERSRGMGLLIKDIWIDRAFASMQVRSIETLASMLEAKGQYHVPVEHTDHLNERDYGDYTGKSKWEMEKLLGHEAWERVRRDWDEPVPNGETLRMVYDRVIPFYITKIVPLLESGNNVLIVAHGNSIRSLMKYIESISDEGVSKVEMLFGGILIYETDDKGRMIRKQIRQVTSKVNA